MKMFYLSFFLVIVLFMVGCASKVERIEGTVFSVTVGGETKYAKGEKVYMFKVNDKSTLLYNRIRYRVSNPGFSNTDFGGLNEIVDELLLSNSILALDTLDMIKDKDIEILQTLTDDKGIFTFTNIEEGEYYFFSKNTWNLLSYDDNLNLKKRVIGEVKHKKVKIDKYTDKIIL